MYVNCNKFVAMFAILNRILEKCEEFADTYFTKTMNFIKQIDGASKRDRFHFVYRPI